MVQNTSIEILPPETDVMTGGSSRLRVIFSVDMFNEGVDIPDVDMVLFLRPTESPVVFLQQLGRGLRKARGKEYLMVLDFIWMNVILKRL